MDTDRTFRPQKLSDCLGQDEIRRNLKVYVASAKARNEPIEHLLFSGHPGLGKTTLAGALAAEMGGKLITVNAPSLKIKGDLVAIIGQLGPGDILFLDEIHALKRELQEILYPVLEDFKLEIAAGPSTISMKLAPFTLIGATTHQGKLSKPMRDRFGDICELRLYKPEELVAIVIRASEKMGFKITTPAAYAIANRAQGTPRIALRITRRVRDFALSARVQLVNDMFVHTICQQIGIDSAGLDSIARRMLRLLVNRGKAVGLQAIAAQLGECLETIESCVEPFLLAQEFVERAQSGRVVTPKGAQHLQSCGFAN